jgi:hypothetical protein
LPQTGAAQSDGCAVKEVGSGIAWHGSDGEASEGPRKSIVYIRLL